MITLLLLNSCFYYMYIKFCTIITPHFKGTATGSICPMVHQGKLVVLHGTPSKLVVTVVQQLVLKKAWEGCTTRE